MDITESARIGKLSDILNISKNISYDPLTKSASIRAFTYWQSLILLSFMMKVSTGELNTNYILSNNLIVEEYKKYIKYQNLDYVNNYINDYVDLYL